MKKRSRLLSKAWTSIGVVLLVALLVPFEPVVDRTTITDWPKAVADRAGDLSLRKFNQKVDSIESSLNDGPPSRPATFQSKTSFPVSSPERVQDMAGVGDITPEELLAAYYQIPGAGEYLNQLAQHSKDTKAGELIEVSDLPRDENGFAVVNDETLRTLGSDPRYQQAMDGLIAVINAHVAEISAKYDQMEEESDKE